MKQQGTIACEMRDKLEQARGKKEITPKEITNRLYKAGIPDWLQSQILQMVKHNQYQRITCPIEQAMEMAVNMTIIETIS